MNQPRTHGFLEYKHRVVYSLLRAAARVAMRLDVPLGQLEELLRMACFQEARDVWDLDLGSIAERFGKSLRTVSTIHKQYRGDFFAPEREVALRRAVAQRLADRPHTRADLAAALPDRSEAELEAAVADLLRERKILQDCDLLVRNPEDHDFFDEASVAARVDGLNRQMDIVAATVWDRLVEPDARRPAAARSYVFQATDQDFEAMLEALRDLLRDRAIAADVAARTAGAGGRRAITFAAAALEEDR